MCVCVFFFKLKAIYNKNDRPNDKSDKPQEMSKVERCVKRDAQSARRDKRINKEAN